MQSLEYIPFGIKRPNEDGKYLALKAISGRISVEADVYTVPIKCPLKAIASIT